MAKRKKGRRLPVEVVFQEMGAPVTASAGVVLVLDMLAAKRILPGPVGVELFTGQDWLEGQQMLAAALLNVLGLDRVEDVLRLVCGVADYEELLEEARRVPEEDWKALEGEKRVEMAEVPFVPAEVCRHRSGDTLRYLAVRRAAPGDLGLGKDVMPARGGRPAMRLRLLFTNIPAPEAATPKDGEERLPPASGSRVLELANGRCGEGEENPLDPEAGSVGGNDAVGEVRGECVLVGVGGAEPQPGGAAVGVRAGGELAASADEAAAGGVLPGGGGRVVRHARREQLVIGAAGMEPFRMALARLGACATGVSSHQARSGRDRAQSPIIGGWSRRDGAGGPDTGPTERSGGVLAPYTPKNRPRERTQPARSAPILLMFTARHIRSHSARTVASPRKLKRRNPSTSLIHPFGPSDSHFRLAYRARSAGVASLFFIRAPAGRFFASTAPCFFPHAPAPHTR